MAMIVLPPAVLLRAVSDILLALETPPEVAERVAASLVESNLVGHDSHGVMRLPAYVSAIRAGTLIPSGKLEIIQETPAAVFLDCGWTFGQYACGKAIDMAIDKAHSVGVGLAVLRHCDHTGRVGEYVTMAAERGCVGQVICNGSSPGGLVAPYGGMSRALGANPIAWGIPGGEGSRRSFSISRRPRRRTASWRWPPIRASWCRKAGSSTSMASRHADLKTRSRAAPSLPLAGTRATP
jgi:LDH2 family malate/lactate/ureidoglycolate dehydrogenase